jgi:cytochrome P450
MTSIEPVNDWATDYDIFDPGFIRNPYPIMAELRETCPVAHTDRWRGSWMPTRYEDVVAVAHNHEVFTSRGVLVTPPPDVDPNGPGPVAAALGAVGAPPITSDPPEHHWHRRLILPAFSPQAVAHYEQGTRDLCNSLIDGFIESGRADAAEHYAQQIPVRVIGAMLGVPVEMSDEFTTWVRGFLEHGLTDQAMRMDSIIKIVTYFRAELADRRANPRPNDLITELLHAEVDGQPVPEIYVLGVCNLMLIAGIDTTWSAIGASLWHLATHPEHQEALRDNADLWPTAIEELLRAYSPVTMARIVDRDTEFQGCPMNAGDRVLMSFASANRDPAMFENPDEVILDREHNRHVAFGSGIHRCAGSNLARLELRVALQTWLSRIGEFRLEDPSAVTWAGGQVRGPRQCGVVFAPGTRLN